MVVNTALEPVPSIAPPLPAPPPPKPPKLPNYPVPLDLAHVADAYRVITPGCRDKRHITNDYDITL
jgi:hypothetical protein